MAHVTKGIMGLHPNPHQTWDFHKSGANALHAFLRCHGMHSSHQFGAGDHNDFCTCMKMPNAAFVLLFRPMHHWMDSVEQWQDGNLRKSLILCNATGFPSGVGGTREELQQWFCDQVNRAGQFVRDCPSTC